ncbi:MAG: flagellar motor switch protein FliN [Planctomycetota bacterium]
MSDGPESEVDGAEPQVGGSGESATSAGGSSEEMRIRSELGIGSPKIEADQKVIDQLLEEAVVGYEDIFSGVDMDDAAVDGGHTEDELGTGGGYSLSENLELLRDVHMRVKVELGRGQMYLKDILRLGQGSVVELERLAGDPLDIYVNDKIIARGEVLVLNENFCIRITEICDPADTLRQN